MQNKKRLWIYIYVFILVVLLLLFFVDLNFTGNVIGTPDNLDRNSNRIIIFHDENSSKGQFEEKQDDVLNEIEDSIKEYESLIEESINSYRQLEAIEEEIYFKIDEFGRLEKTLKNVSKKTDEVKKDLSDLKEKVHDKKLREQRETGKGGASKYLILAFINIFSVAFIYLYFNEDKKKFGFFNHNKKNYYIDFTK